MVSCLSTKLWFGKYKGSTIETILKDNPGYLLWAHRNTDTFRMTDELVEEAEAMVSLKRKGYWQWDSEEAYDLDLAFKDAFEDTFED